MGEPARAIKAQLVVPLQLTDKSLAKIIPLMGEPVGAWVEDAQCRNQDDLFFSPSGTDWTEAKKICDECPVRRQCLEYALRNKEIHGTWGGMNQLELRWLLAVDAHGKGKRYPTAVRCPWCHTSSIKLDAPPPRSGGPERAYCTNCDFEWKRQYVPKRGRRKTT